MKCKVTPSAKKQILNVLKEQTDKDVKLRVYVEHAHGDHAHYGIGLDYKKPNDIINASTPGVEVLLEKHNEFLNGIVRGCKIFCVNSQFPSGSSRLGGHQNDEDFKGIHATVYQGK